MTRKFEGATSMEGMVGPGKLAHRSFGHAARCLVCAVGEGDE